MEEILKDTYKFYQNSSKQKATLKALATLKQKSYLEKQAQAMGELNKAFDDGIKEGLKDYHVYFY